MYIARPPNKGVGLAWAWRPPGWAMTPYRRDRRIAIGTATTQTTNATRKGHNPGSRWSRRLISAALLKKSPDMRSLYFLQRRVWCQTSQKRKLKGIFGGWSHAVGATPAADDSSMNCANFFAGVFQPRVSRGRRLSLAATRSRSSWL